VRCEDGNSSKEKDDGLKRLERLLRIFTAGVEPPGLLDCG
jgi:hypothetical protein